MSDRILSQDEIDGVFKKSRAGTDVEPEKAIHVYDFRRPDRIAKDQLRAIHQLHENFARSLAASLSAYLRAYVVVNLVSVEQLSFMEFTRCLPSPTCMITLRMKPYDGNAVLEINPGLAFPILEMLLGGSGKSAAKITREVTEIEQSILDGLYRIILNDLRNAWQVVSAMEFSVEGHETEPSLLQILAPNEAVVAISIEVRIGECTSMMNIGIPAIMVKMLRQKFDQQWSVRRTEATAAEHARVLRLLQPAKIKVDTRLTGPTITVEELMDLQEGDVISFDYPIDRPIDFIINGKLKFRGEIVGLGRKRAVCLQTPFRVLD